MMSPAEVRKSMQSTVRPDATGFTAASWQPTRFVFLLAAVVLPPVGLVLLWLRPGIGIIRKLFGSVVMALLGIAYLFLFFGLRLEPDGSGIPTIASFTKPESHYAALERSRAAQRQQSAPASAPVPTVETRTPEAAPGAPEPRLDFADRNVGAPDVPGVYWTDFRGPRRDGHYDETEILTVWPDSGLTPLWRQPVGGGYASFVIAEGRAFTIEQRRHLEVVAAYDVESGRELWTHSWPAEFRETMGGDGPRATPTWHDGRLYALGAAGELRCLDAESGKLLWSRNILADNGAQNLNWGMAAAPLVVDDKVIVLPGGRSGKSVVAYHKQTGEAVWKALDDQQAYTSPMLVTLAGRRQLLVVSGSRAMGLTVEDGTVLWDYPWVTQYGVNAAQPLIIDENHFFISAGYDHGAALVEVTRTESGFAARTVWENNQMKNKFTSSVLYQGHIYGLDESILACVDARTGERKWKGGRYGYGQVVLASGHLIVLTEGGELVLVKATPGRHLELARFSAIEGKTWNHPAIAGGHLLVRNAREMAAFKITPRP